MLPASRRQVACGLHSQDGIVIESPFLVVVGTSPLELLVILNPPLFISCLASSQPLFRFVFRCCLPLSCSV